MFWHRPALMLLVSDLLFAIFSVLVLYIGLFAVVHWSIFPIENIQVDGKIEHTTPKQIQDVSKKLQGNFFTIDLIKTKASFEQLPWVSKAQVRRKWPSRLDVILEEHQPLARWDDKSLVDLDGEVFATGVLPDETQNLPKFTGVATNAKEMANYYKKFKLQLDAIGLTIQELRFTNRRAWEVILSNRLILNLGTDQVENRLNRFVIVYRQIEKRLPETATHVDLRYPNGFAVKIAPDEELSLPKNSSDADKIDNSKESSKAEQKIVPIPDNLSAPQENGQSTKSDSANKQADID